MLFTEPSPESAASQIARGLTATMSAEIERRIAVREQSWSAFWENSQATPQEILSALGNQAATALTASSVDAGWFVSLAAATGKDVSEFIDPKFLELKDGWQVTMDEDGTATATPPAE